MAGTHGATLKLRNVNAIFGGHVPLDRPKGGFITVNYLSDQITLESGIDSSIFIENDDLSAEIFIRVMQHSPTNAIFSAFFLARVGLPLVITHVGGTDVFTAARAKITRIPNIVYSDAAEMREWRLLTGNLAGFVGGIPPEVVV